MLIVLLSCGFLLWLTSALWNLRNAKGVISVSAAMDYPLAERPRVSILIPARNEDRILRTSLSRFLQLDYDNYEVILVDDGSTDGTAEIAAEFLRSYPERLRVYRVEDLPPGWVGKSHALHTAFEAAQGDWVLATDADIEFHPKVLHAGLWLAEREQADLVSIFAYAECVSFWEKLMMPGFSLLLATFFPCRKINDSTSSVAVASGGFILMRRAVWAGLGGYRSIRSEMIDDLNTARIVKHSGHRIFAAITRDLLSTRMYESFHEIWEGLRKHAFAGNRYSVAKLLVAVGGIGLTNVLPVVAMFYSAIELYRRGAAGPGAWQMGAVFSLSCAQYYLAVGIHLPIVRYYGISAVYALLTPLGASIYAIISLDSMIRTLAGTGVSWKRRRYGKPIESKNGQEPAIRSRESKSGADGRESQ